MEAEARKRTAMLKKKEKEDALRERQRIRAELEKDKRERAANKGKLSSKLGIDGYNPDAIQVSVQSIHLYHDRSKPYLVTIVT